MISHDQLASILHAAQAASRLGWGVYTGMCLGAPFGFAVNSEGVPYLGGHIPPGMDEDLFLARLLERLEEDYPPQIRLMA